MKTPYIVSSEFLFFHCLLYGEYITLDRSFWLYVVIILPQYLSLLGTAQKLWERV